MKNIFVSILVIIFSLSCTKKTELVENQPVKISVEKPKNTINFTKIEREYISKLKKKKILKIASREKKTVYEPQKDGTAKGFNYLLVKSFTDYLGIELEVKTVSFSDYFNKDGKTPEIAKTEINYSYTPDLIKEVDLYVDSITILPWREKLLRFVKIIPTMQLIITRKGEKIKTLEELKGKLIAVTPQTSYAERLKEIEIQLNTKFKYFETATTDLMMEAVANKKADLTLRDSNRVIYLIKSGKQLSVNIPASEVQYLAWALKKDDETLASILEKYIEYAEKNGIMNKFWVTNYEISLQEYKKLLGN